MFGIPFSNPRARHSHRLNVLGVLRVICAGAFLATVVLGSLLSTAKAKVGESLIQFGEHLIAATDGRVSSAATTFLVNGLEVHRLTVTTTLGLKDTLDRLHASCEAHTGAQTPEALLTATPRQKRTSGFLARDGVYRHEGENAGVLACIDTGGPLGLTELTTRLKDFARTGNLSSIGRLRYMLVRRGKSTTSVLALWTDGDAPLLHLFPKVGDAPGRDIADVPRPEDSLRVLSASQPGASYALAVYRSTGNSAQTVSRRYETQLLRHGWRVSPVMQSNTLIVQKGTRTLFVRSSPAGGNRIATTVAELS